jgi:DNA sulfur modification protein DndE
MTSIVKTRDQISRRALFVGAGALSFAAANAGPIAVANAGDAPTKVTSPDAAHAAGAESWLSGLALQAATYAAPIVAMYNLRDTTSVGSSAKAPPNEIWRVSDIADPQVAEQLGYVTPNVNVIYGFGFMDLAREPIVLKALNSRRRYYMIQICDMWTNSFAYVGGLETGYEGGVYALVGPGWQGELPDGAKRIHCPTRWIELQPRVHVKNAADLAAARDVLNAITVHGLAKYRGGLAPPATVYQYATPKIDPKVASSQMRFVDPLQFWEIFSAAMNENPPPVNEIDSVLPQFAYLGIELGKPWKRESVQPQILDQMRSAAEGIGAMMMPLLPYLGRTANGWNIPPASVGAPGADYPVRALVAVFGLTSNTTKEAIYYTSVSDADGKPLTGTNRYALTFEDMMPCIEAVSPGFWSITAYDSATGYTIPNAIRRYALGGDSGLTRRAEGSFTIYVQRDDPGPERRSNWLPISSAPFYLILRVYAPAPVVSEGLKNPATFQGPPTITLVGQA